MNQGFARNDHDPDNPGYAAWQHYRDTVHWADATLARLKLWGFATVGGWSDYPILRQSKEMTLGFTPVLHIGASAGAPWWDMWDPKVMRKMEDIARDQILAVRDDPRLMGYYTDNELGWWNATIFKMTLEQSARSGQRQRLVRLLRDTYHNDWPSLLRDFEPENADGWSALERGGILFLRSGGSGIQVVRRFLGLVAERYYQLVHQIIRKYDQRALILGDRYQSFYYPEVARACAPYVDAVSSNLNAGWNDGTLLRFYLDTLHTLTGKPILVSEIYMAASENRSGNQNSHGLFPVVATQNQRADAWRNSLTALVRLPYVVGADWFQYYDEPTHGRDDGENFNFGLVDIQDRAYPAVTSVTARLDLNGLKTRSPLEGQKDSDGIPPAPSEPMVPFQPLWALQRWDRERGFVKPSSNFPLADLYLCWSPQAIYVGLYAMDIVEDAYYRNRSVPKSDRPLWFVQINNSGPVRVRLGADLEPLVNDLDVRVQRLSGFNLNGREVAVMEWPARRLGKNLLHAGDTLELSTTFLTHCQAYRTEWRGSFTLKE